MIFIGNEGIRGFSTNLRSGCEFEQNLPHTKVFSKCDANWL